MELDDFRKAASKQLSGLSGNGIKQESRINSVIEQFRLEQAKTRKQSIAWAIVLVTLSAFYFTRFVTEAGLYSAGMMITGTGMVMGAIYKWLASKPVPDSSYSLPLMQFLSIADRRMRYLPAPELFKVIPILIILGTGGGMIFVGRLLLYTENLYLLLAIWLVFYTVLCIFGYLASRKIWKKKYGELQGSIATSLKESQES